MTTGTDDLVWRALASSLRRRVLDALRDGPLTTGDLADRFPDVSRYAVMQHLGVLCEASLVLVHREGRKRWNSLNVVPLRQAFERWVTPYQAMWADALIDVKRRVEGGHRAPHAPEKRGNRSR